MVQLLVASGQGSSLWGGGGGRLQRKGEGTPSSLFSETCMWEEATPGRRWHCRPW